jgi:hypothetical protein
MGSDFVYVLLKTLSIKNLSFAFVLFLFFSEPVFGMSAAEIYQNSKNSIISLVGNRGSGTGFVYKDLLVITNHHVVHDNHDLHGVGANQKRIDFERLLYQNQSDDIALLMLDRPMPGLKLSEDSPTVGDRIFVIGNPMGLRTSLTDGIISRITNSEGKNQIQFTAPIAVGSSGSPIMNEAGEVIGVANSGLRADEINFGSSVESIIRGIKIAGKLLMSLEAKMPERCKEKSDAAACTEVGKKYESAGLWGIAARYYERACTIGALSSCQDQIYAEYQSSQIDFDRMLHQMDRNCALFPGSFSCEFKELTGIAKMTAPILSGSAYEFKVEAPFSAYSTARVRKLGDRVFDFLHGYFPESKALLFLRQTEPEGRTRRFLGGVTRHAIPWELLLRMKRHNPEGFAKANLEDLKPILIPKTLRNPDIEFLSATEKAPFLLHFRITEGSKEENAFLLFGDRNDVFRIGMIGGTKTQESRRHMFQQITASIAIRDPARLVGFGPESDLVPPQQPAFRVAIQSGIDPLILWFWLFMFGAFAVVFWLRSRRLSRFLAESAPGRGIKPSIKTKPNARFKASPGFER